MKLFKKTIQKNKDRFTNHGSFQILKYFLYPQKREERKYSGFAEALADYNTDEATLQKSYRNFCFMAYMWGFAFLANLFYLLMGLFIDGQFHASNFFFGCICFGCWFKGAAYAYSLKYHTLEVKRVLMSPLDWFPDFTHKVKMVYKDKPVSRDIDIRR